MNKIFKDNVELVIIIIGIILVIISFSLCIDSLHKNHSNTTSPVEECRTDSAKEANKVLIIEVEHLDSIKHVKSVEVTTLDNDSTLELFYELIRK